MSYYNRSVASRHTHTDALSYTTPLIIRFAICSVLLSMAVISLPSTVPIHHSMNLPSLPSEVLNIAASYQSWQFLPLHTITPPWSSKPTTTTLPPITTLQRQHNYRDTARTSNRLLFFHYLYSTYHSTSFSSYTSSRSRSSFRRVALFQTLFF